MTILISNKNGVSGMGRCKILLNLIFHRKLWAKRHTPPWIDAACLKLIRKKNRTLSKAKKTKDPEIYKEFKQLRNRIKNVVKYKANQYLYDLCDGLFENPKRFWSYLKSKSKTSALPQILRDDKGNEALDDKNKAELFNDYFFKMFNSQDNIPLPQINTYADPELSSINLSREEVEKSNEGSKHK